MSLASAATWAVGVVLYRRLGATLAPLQLNFAKNLIVLALVAATVPLLHGLTPPDLSIAEIALTLASGAIGIAIADTLYFRALNELGAGRMGIIGNSYSPFVILLSFLFLDERLTWAQIAGFGLVSAGVLLIARPPAEWRTQPRHTGRGVLIGLVAVLLMAMAIVMVKRVLEEHPLLWVTLVRMLGAIGGMLVIAAARRELTQLWPRGPIDWKSLAAAAFVGQYLSMVLWLGGYKFTQASIAAVLNETASVFILLLAFFWLKEPLSRRALLGVALTLAGVVCMLDG